MGRCWLSIYDKSILRVIFLHLHSKIVWDIHDPSKKCCFIYQKKSYSLLIIVKFFPFYLVYTRWKSSLNFLMVELSIKNENVPLHGCRLHLFLSISGATDTHIKRLFSVHFYYHASNYLIFKRFWSQIMELRYVFYRIIAILRYLVLNTLPSISFLNIVLWLKMNEKIAWICRIKIRHLLHKIVYADLSSSK